eukprot:m.14266 g.14266  ORF g.14266 m.14266 type:complete len:323 (-) comp10066_c0_seq1:342-1310(-)
MAMSDVGWLVGYILINLAVTFLNKGLFTKYNWPYPTTLALWHYTCTSVGTIFYVRILRMVPAAKLDWNGLIKMMLFSILFNVNIWISNYSLNMVSLAMHQMVRALVPGFTVAISFILLRKRYSPQVLISLGIIFFGVVTYSCKGEISYTLIGVVVTGIGGFLAALKGVLTNLFMVGSLKLHPMDLLTYSTTFSAIQLLIAMTLFSDELSKSLDLEYERDYDLILALCVNGFGAFSLNIVSFFANKKTDPLAMNIGGVTKQILGIVLGIVIFATPVTSFGLIGVCVTVVGIIMYARFQYIEKQQTPVQLPTSSPQKVDVAVKV